MKYTGLLASLIVMVGCQHVTSRSPSSEFSLKPRVGLEKLTSIATQHALIVVHATTEFDENKVAGDGIDQLVREFKAKGRPVIYLVNDLSEKGYQRWYTADRSPDFVIFSEGGEHNLPIAMNEVTIVGGFFGSTDTMNGCHALAIKDAIRMHFEASNAPLTVHVPIKATYFYSEWESNREVLLKTGKPLDLSSTGIPRYPFATLFFLREDGGAGDDGNEPDFAHSYFGTENKNYRPGEQVSRDKYQFNFFVNEELFEAVKGPGKRIVNIKLETN